VEKVAFNSHAREVNGESGMKFSENLCTIVNEEREDY